MMISPYRFFVDFAVLVFGVCLSPFARERNWYAMRAVLDCACRRDEAITC